MGIPSWLCLKKQAVNDFVQRRMYGWKVGLSYESRICLVENNFEEKMIFKNLSKQPSSKVYYDNL